MGKCPRSGSLGQPVWHRPVYDAIFSILTASGLHEAEAHFTAPWDGSALERLQKKTSTALASSKSLCGSEPLRETPGLHRVGFHCGTTVAEMAEGLRHSQG
jgi:hypothetical protein